MKIKVFKDNYGVNKLFIKNLITYFIIMIIVIVLPIFVLYNSITEKYYTQMNAANASALSRAVNTFDTMVSQVEMYVVDLYVNQEIRAFAAAENEHYFLENVREHLRFYKRINNYVNHIYIYNAKKDYVVESGDYRPALENEKQTLHNPGTEIAGNVYFDVFAKNNKYPYIIRISKQLDEDSYVAVDIDLRKLNTVINSEASDEEYNKVFVVDNSRKIICSDNLNNYFGKNFDSVAEKKDEVMTEIDGELYVYASASSAKYPVEIAALTNVEYFSGVRVYTVVYTISIIIAAFILSFIIAYFISVRSINPIRQIVGALKMRKTDDELLKKMPKELVYIIEDLLKNIKKENVIMRDTNTRLLLFKLANMEALQAQINPHFLHNTIDSINWLAYFQLGKDNKVSNLLADLSDLYRITLQTDNYIIPLGIEIQHITMYINLLNVRFENPITLVTDIDKELSEYDVLKFMLQPIVENSVYHGIIPAKKEGTVKVCANVDGENMYISVEDNGIGMSEEMLVKINQELEKGPDEFDESILKVMYGNEVVNTTLQEIRDSWWLNRKKSDIGVGVKNTNNRIKLIFGDEYNIKVYSLKNGGTKVLIKLPISRTKKNK